ncbi:MAG: DUF378 domain-containing protein [Candidatus Gastranaerophilaceae bacterium]|jgi:uncharacterized membrane protein YuzA (DUF378 family)|nr:DUF378 domain-containing protein [Candidatus Gastranaerophilaceae bacterium]
MNILRSIAFVLVMVGAIVWGILGIFNVNLVAALFGDATILSRIVYALVGISAIILMATYNHDECYCDCNEKSY